MCQSSSVISPSSSCQNLSVQRKVWVGVGAVLMVSAVALAVLGGIYS